MEEKKTNSKKKIIIGVVVIIIVAILAGAGIMANDYNQRVIIGKEIDTINTSGKVDQEIKTTGKYAEVEKALKSYITEYQAAAQEVVNLYKDKRFTTILTADNYKKDGPEFKESKKLVAEAKKTGEEAKTKLAEMVTAEYKEKKATESGLTGKYKDLFIDSIKLEQELKTVNKTIDNVNNYLTKINDIFDFLSKNKGKWEVSGDKVQFNEISLYTKYNSLVTLVSIAAKNVK